MLEPYFQINHAIKKKRAPLLTNEAMANMPKLISNAPALMVKTLYGIGVKPAVKITQKSHSTNKFFILSYKSIVNPGMLVKKKLANGENSPAEVNHKTCPI